MDFFNQAGNQMRDLFVSMTPAARITSVLLLGVIVVSLGYLVQNHSAGPDEFLFNGEFLPGDDVDRAEAAIAKAGLNDYERVGNRIRVPRGKKSAYLAAVADAGALPPNFHQLLESALDLGPFADEKTRRERLKAAREQQLSMMIRDMDGVEDAKVIYDVSESRGLSRVGRATATVSVLPSSGESLNARRTNMIRQAVAGAINDLKPEEVVVVPLGGGPSFGEEISPESFDSPYFKTRVTYEQLLQKNILQHLANIPGVKVQVTAELDDALTRKTTITTPEGEAAALQETTQIGNRETTHTRNGGRPGLVAQGPGRDRAETNDVTVKNTDNTEATKANYLVGVKEDFLVQAGLVPKHVRASIAVPTHYLVDVYREKQLRRNADPDEPLPADFDTTLKNIEIDIIQSIETAVAPLLPKELAESSYSNVTVSFFESLTPETQEPIPTSTMALGWASQNFSSITMACIALVSLVMLRSIVKGIPPVDPVSSSAGSVLSFGSLRPMSDDADADGGVPEEIVRPKLKLKKGVSLKDELTDIVREDPDSAAAILRSWISDAG